MKKTFFAFLFLLSVLFFSCPDLVHADETEEMKYLAYIDEMYPMELPSLSVFFNGQPIFSDSLLGVEYGNILGFEFCDLNTLKFSSEFSVQNYDVADVGFNLSDMFLRVEFDFLLISSEGVKSSYSDFLDVRLSDIYKITSKYLTYEVSYGDLLGLCPFNESDIVVVNSISFTVFSGIFDRCGTSYLYQFYYDNNNYADCSISRIEQYEYTSTDGKHYLGSLSDFGAVRELNNYHCSIATIHPDDAAKVNTKNVFDYIKNFILSIKDIIAFVVSFCITILNWLPEIVVSAIPFLPDPIVYAFVYIMYFGLVVGVYKLFRG